MPSQELWRGLDDLVCQVVTDLQTIDAQRFVKRSVDEFVPSAAAYERRALCASVFWFTVVSLNPHECIVNREGVL